MQKYQKMPDAVEAVQWKIDDWLLEERVARWVGSSFTYEPGDWLPTLISRSGKVRVRPGEYIVKVTDGTFHVWPRVAFQETYVKVA